MAKKTRTKAELETELRLLKRQRRAGNVASVLNNLIRWAGLGVLGYFTYRSISALAGEKTAADIGIKLFADVRLSEAITFFFGGSGILYGIRQRSLRRKTVERLQGRIQTLERERDPGRSSSGLTPRGDTHPKDK